MGIKLKALLIIILAGTLYLSWRAWLWQTAANPGLKPKLDQGFALPGRYYQVTIPPGQEDVYLSADYRLWIPADVPELRGVLVKQHGCGDDAAKAGLDQVYDLQWQALARNHGFALMGTQLLSEDKPCEYWALINYGSGRAFLRALDALAQESQHPELTRIPWALWGHSGGADWAMQMLQEYSDRTLAVVAVRGGAFTLLGHNPNLEQTPVLFLLGAAESPPNYEVLTLPQSVVARYRQFDALWAFGVEVGAGHETAQSRALAIPYFDAILSQRLPTAGGALGPVDGAGGWLGDPEKGAIAPLGAFTGNTKTAVWLPNLAVAEKWRDYVTTGEVRPRRKAAAPMGVTLESSPQGVVVRWDYVPDLEQGLPNFRIYRDGAAVGEVAGQGHNFHDGPKPVAVALEFHDPGGSWGVTYRVVAVNVLGESDSEATNLPPAP